MLIDLHWAVAGEAGDRLREECTENQAQLLGDGGKGAVLRSVTSPSASSPWSAGSSPGIRLCLFLKWFQLKEGRLSLGFGEVLYRVPW